MPTGYTCKVQDGNITELKDYILDCSKNFGALMHMREDNINAVITHREVSTYHLDQLNKINERFEKFKKLNDDEIQKVVDDNYTQSLKDKQRSLKKFQESKQRYLNMLEKVKAWQPPTEEHKNLKQFATEQLKSSLDFDSSDSMKKYYSEEIIKDNVEDYKTYMSESYSRDITYHTNGYKKEVDSVNENNLWIDDLINSFR